MASLTMVPKYDSRESRDKMGALSKDLLQRASC